MIRALGADTIRTLSAGQVLSTLPAVIKELMENSLDAHAKLVVIALERYGMDVITVTDDGTGFQREVKQEGDAFDVTDILSRRVSSKRQRPTRLTPTTEQLTTDVEAGHMESRMLGFRGEALHSLAQLSDVVIDTKSDTDHCGMVLSHDAASNRTQTADSTRTMRGTTVTVTGLFTRFPVRRQELERLKKKQLQDTMSLVKQYAFSRPDVKLVLQHRPAAGEAVVTLVSTTGSGDVKRSLSEAYGGRQLSSMLHVQWVAPQCDITGFISPIGSGRATHDIQIVSLDGRLVDLPKVSKALQETFSECHPNASQRTCPAFFLALTTDGKAAYDVNVAPNKRRVLLQLEQEWVDAVRQESLKIFQTHTDVLEVTSTPALHSKMLRAQALSDERRLSLTLTPVSATSFAPVVVSSGSRAADQSPSEQPRKRSRDEPTTDTGRVLTFSEHDDTPSGESTHSEEASAQPSEAITDHDVDYRSTRREFRFESTFPSLEALVTSMKRIMTSPTPDAATVQPVREKKSRRTSKNLAAQTSNELQQLLYKADFLTMKLHGQFNHGFLLASLRDHLFIIDQHASDEKYNYEQLCSKYVARPQPLVRPIQVAMDPEETLIALEHQQALRSHGFIVSPAADASGIMVASVPVLPYDTVVPQDVSELTSQLLQYQSIVRPLKAVWHSMATKACRSSIMIGAVLSDKAMRSIVDHLSTLEQPWNCPHGRPTLKYLGTLSGLTPTTNHTS